MSYPTWRVESWYDPSNNKLLGFRVVKGFGDSHTVAANGEFAIDPNDQTTKILQRSEAMRLRDRLTADETDPKVLAAECRSILRSLLVHSSERNHHPSEVTVSMVPLTVWLPDRLDRLCAALQVKEDS